MALSDLIQIPVRRAFHYMVVRPLVEEVVLPEVVRRLPLVVLPLVVPDLRGCLRELVVRPEVVLPEVLPEVIEPLVEPMVVPLVVVPTVVPVVVEPLVVPLVEPIVVPLVVLPLVVPLVEPIVVPLVVPVVVPLVVLPLVVPLVEPLVVWAWARPAEATRAVHRAVAAKKVVFFIANRRNGGEMNGKETTY